MPAVQDDGLCVRHWDWSETSQTVTILTRTHGLIRGLAKGSRREKGAFSGGIELLTRGEVMGIVKARSDLVTLTGWDLREPYRGLRASLPSFYAGMYLADLVLGLISDQDPHPRVFEEMDSALGQLAIGHGADLTTLETVLVMQWRLLEETGTKPDLDTDIRTGGPLPDAEVCVFVPGHGGFAMDGVPGWRVRRETLETLRRIRSGPSRSTDEGQIHYDRGVRLLGAYIEHLTGRAFLTLTPLMQVISGRSRRD